jgi:molybdopterin-guanine dinucleotide biosynthesis adapter protein
MRPFGIAGWSGSGKTTMLARLIPALMERGLTVSSIKQANPSFDIDHPGKDSFQHRMAGSREVLVTSDRRWALMHELRDNSPPTLPELLEKMTLVDVALIEGFRHEPHPKLEVHRTHLGKPVLAPTDQTVVAIAVDKPLAGIGLPQFAIDDIDAITEFVIGYLELPARRP